MMNIQQETSKVNEFVEYVLSFYGSGSDLYDMGATRDEVLQALAVRLSPDCGFANENGVLVKDIPFDGDSFDREYVRDIILAIRKSI